MPTLLDLAVPDIGEFENVTIIEVYVRPGDALNRDAPICTLESDKATMDVPATTTGRVREVLVQVGDRVSAGSLLVRVETEDVTTTPAAADHGGTVDVACDLLVLGAGPGGYSAAFRGADLGLDTVLVERHATLGGVCLNVGCIPSKALLHVVATIDAARHLAEQGVSFGEPKIDLERLRGWKDRVVGKLTGGLAGLARGRKVRVLRGCGTFGGPHHLEVEQTEDSGRARSDGVRVVHFKQCIIAAGSRPVTLPFMPDDPRVIDSTTALALESVPRRMLVVGGGIIGLEMATVYSSLGTDIDLVELEPGLLPGTDRDLVRVFEKMNSRRFQRILLDTRCVAAEATRTGIQVTFEGSGGPESQTYDRVLVAVGRRPNGGKVSAERARVVVDGAGFIPTDEQMRTNVPHIFAVGDVVGQPMLAHKAVHQGHVAAEAAAGHRTAFDVRQIPSVAYTDPELAWAGMTEEQALADGIQVDKALFPWAASGRALANDRSEGFTKLLFDAETGCLVGGGIVGTSAGDLIGEVCLAIEMGCDATDIGKTIHPHPTLCETVGLAAEVAAGVCTDLPTTPKR